MIDLPRLFGTNGVRGVVNEYMNLELASNLGSAVGTYLEGGRVAIGTDTRTSNEMLKSAVISGLLSAGSRVVDLGIVPTPTLQYHVKNSDVDHGIVVTASHNPPEFNGIKCVDSDGTELARAEEEKVERLFFDRSFRRASWEHIGGVDRETGAVERYIRGIMDHVDVDSVNKAAPGVVLDCGNGAGSLVSPYLLERLGCGVVTLNAHPQGTFPGHDSEPTPENLDNLIKAVVDFGADVGIAHDGDADRTIFIDEKGNYLHGDRILALVARELLYENSGGLIVTTVASSMAMGDVVDAGGGEIVYTRVGSPIVARKMMETGALFGGEENGGLIFPLHQYCRDGAMAAAAVVEILAKHGKGLSELVAELPRYHLYKTKCRCPHDKKVSALQAFANGMEGKKIDMTDGVKIIYDGAWVLVRPSGTEPIYRIFAEAGSFDAAKELAQENKSILEKLIGEL